GAERYAAVHAARALLLGFGVGQGVDEFIQVFQPYLWCFIGFFDALEFKKAGNFAHVHFPQAAICWGLAARQSSPRARRYSVGITLTKARRDWFQLSRMSRERKLPV